MLRVLLLTVMLFITVKRLMDDRVYDFVVEISWPKAHSFIPLLMDEGSLVFLLWGSALQTSQSPNGELTCKSLIHCIMKAYERTFSCNVRLLTGHNSFHLYNLQCWSVVNILM